LPIVPEEQIVRHDNFVDFDKKSLDTYTSGGSRASGPGATDSDGELADEGVPGVGVGVSVNVRNAARETGKLISVLLRGLLATEPLVLLKSAFNCVDHCYFF